MMPSKSLISFIMAFAVATGVPASATPVARFDECNTGFLECCNFIAYPNDPTVLALEGPADIAIPVDPSIPLGIRCFPISSAYQCAALPVCCQNISQSGIIDVDCTPIIISV